MAEGFLGCPVGPEPWAQTDLRLHVRPLQDGLEDRGQQVYGVRVLQSTTLGLGREYRGHACED